MRRIEKFNQPLEVDDWAVVQLKYNGEIIDGIIIRYNNSDLCFANNIGVFNGCYDLPNIDKYQFIRERYSVGWAIATRACGDLSLNSICTPSGFNTSTQFYLFSVQKSNGDYILNTDETITATRFINKHYEINGIYSGIKSYHYHHGTYQNKPLMNKNGYKIGVELEVEFNDARKKELFSRSESNWFYMERDGSLNDRGCEIITVPMRPCDIKNPKTWDGLINSLVGKAKSWDSPRCGLHVHLGREILGNNPEQQSETTGKLLFLYHHFLDGTALNTKIFGRTSAYNARDGKTASARAAVDLGTSVFKIKEIKDKVKNDLIGRTRSDRYYDINLTNENTIEFRKGRGSIKTTRIIMVIEYCEIMCKYAKSAQWGKISYDGFLKYMKKNLSSKSYLYRFIDGEVCGEF